MSLGMIIDWVGMFILSSGENSKLATTVVVCIVYPYVVLVGKVIMYNLFHTGLTLITNGSLLIEI